MSEISNQCVPNYSELPERPIGWTREMVMHFNFGSEGGSATFRVKDADKNTTDIGYQYDTRKGGLTGFIIPGDQNVYTWEQLRKAWASYFNSKQGEAA